METVVLYATPGIGHIISMVELAKFLLTHKPSLSITILIPTFPFNTGSYSSYMSSVSTAFPSISFHSLPAVPLRLGEPLEYQNIEEIMFEILRNSNSNVQHFLQSLSINSPVSAFIIDVFCTSALEIAKTFSIPTYIFFTSGATALTLFLNFVEFNKIANDSYRNLGTTKFELPGLFPVQGNQMPEPMLDRGVNYDEIIKISAHVPKSDGIIVNTFEFLEARAVKVFKEGTCLPRTTIPPIYCVGPLIANRGEGGDVKGGEKDECLKWLDLQPSGSVVYLGFGSLGMFDEKQMREIAVGLEKSKVRFLWAVRAPPSEDKAKRFLPPAEPDLESLLPDGFLDRTKGWGFVVKSWAPQVAILAHEAVGGFVTHCGWNSALEAICAGVPMVAWPLYAEKRFNKIVLVEEIKVALPMNESEDRFVSSDEIEMRVKQILNSNEGDAIRKHVLHLSHEAKGSLGEGGTSRIALDRLAASWKR